MRRALTAHDFTTVYRILQQEHGYSQMGIGFLRAHSQPQVSAIMNGRHKVVSFAVLARVVSGLGIPPAYVGLACGSCPLGAATDPARGSVSGPGGRSATPTACVPDPQDFGAAARRVRHRRGGWVW